MTSEPPSDSIESFMEWAYPIVDTTFRNKIQTVQERFEIRFELGNTGKHFRPALALLVCSACNGNITDRTLNMALVPEVIHTVSLYHDDVIDQDDVRRGEPAVHRRLEGVPVEVAKAVTILFGDVTILEMIRTAMELGPKVLPLAVTAAEALIRGVLLEVTIKGAGTPEMYEDIHMAKNAALFALACQLGAISASAYPPIEEAARSYGKHIGLIHQLADDVVDIDKSVRGGTPVGDLAERRSSYPLSLVAATDPELGAAIDAYCRGQAEWSSLEKTLCETGRLERMRELVGRRFATLIEGAQLLCQFFPNRKYAKLLHDMPEMIREQMLSEVKSPSPPCAKPSV